ncbi:MAG: hypothetical protein IT306_02320 [Chloroflexi bacterium]|nr:hypothetical protein [Chloroflexota bacterium]
MFRTLRTFAVLLLLIGLATATPVVCLCAEDGIVGLMSPPATSRLPVPAAGSSLGLEQPRETAEQAPDSAAPNLLAASAAAAAISSVVPTAAGIPSAAPWQLPEPALAAHIALPTEAALLGLVWPPTAPPPQAA